LASIRFTSRSLHHDIALSQQLTSSQRQGKVTKCYMILSRCMLTWNIDCGL
jgi:hypothetical protein